VKFLYNPPLVVKKIFNDFQWNSSVDKVLLTFDDGPDIESTERILDTLNLFKVKAVFFCTGRNIKQNPSVIDWILSEGHEIGNHTFNHKRIDFLRIRQLQNEIDSVNSILKEKHRYNVKYFRPPYGRFNLLTSKFLKEKKLKNIMWSLFTFDYKNDLNVVKFVIRNYLQSNSIVVFHDSLKSKEIIIRALDFFFEEINKKGFETGTPAECLK
jgi:peptidoglycan/xylan/chitin deacetylase (PgdA/CDA1 family)